MDALNIFNPLAENLTTMNTTKSLPTNLPFGFTNSSSSPYILLLQAILFLLPFAFLSHSIYKDYQTFLSLGPGGTPSTPLGYLKIKALSIVSLRNPYAPPSIPAHFRPQQGYLTSFPHRHGKRPVIMGIAPQRQQTEKSSPEIYKLLSQRIVELTKDPRNALIERTSCFEKHSTGLFSSDPITHTCGGEITHAHPSDGSMHLVLHPADAKVLIEAGWAERHPLARGGWFRRFVPREFVMVYAPRNEDEVGIVVNIIAAAVWWVSGIDVVRKETREERFAGNNLNEKQDAKERWNRKMLRRCESERMVSRA
ncbi:hypothetical protein GQ43DRAFT_461970 [Delitschia confertaspora ATCC 74209]|uniref:Luciferase domain-containing protein n=1 Tax=Delitschia confertaspora ATCC 74209 TaxID=1513339 RepID=A0A9P4MRF6_9PLEO|nr:hypothetical protein GQ43DRAFT_461970 [Delitschia confertaspora ATCC 74209]